MKSCMKGKHFLWENDWSMEELDTLFKTAEELKLRYTLDEPTEILKNKTLFVLFFEESVENGSISEHFGKMLNDSGFDGNYKTFCVSGFVPHMKVENAMKLHGLDRESMKIAIKEALK